MDRRQFSQTFGGALLALFLPDVFRHLDPPSREILTARLPVGRFYVQDCTIAFNLDGTMRVTDAGPPRPWPDDVTYAIREKPSVVKGELVTEAAWLQYEEVL